MEYLTIIYFILSFMIDISNIIMNAFIIYALRKLNKLSSISFWLICCLSISDCFVGLSGLAFDINNVWCITRRDCSWILYTSEVRTLFLSYSGRLTTIIAIDRSIRMKFLYKYNNVMTKTKANLMLLFNAVLGIVHFVGSLGPHQETFHYIFLIFHFICIATSCMLYIFTYCSVQQQVSDLNLNLRRNQIALVSNTKIQPSVPPPSQTKAQDMAEGDLASGGSQGNYARQNIFHLSEFQERERKYLAVVDKGSSNSIRCVDGVPERSIGRNLCSNGGKAKCLPGRHNKMTDYDRDDQDTFIQSRDINSAAETTMNNSNDLSHRKRSDNDIGRAMLYITMAMVLCYIPIFLKGFLDFQQVKSDVLEFISIILLLANSSCNAIILTIFSREIRNLIKSLF